MIKTYIDKAMETVRAENAFAVYGQTKYEIANAQEEAFVGILNRVFKGSDFYAKTQRQALSEAAYSKKVDSYYGDIYIYSDDSQAPVYYIDLKVASKDCPEYMGSIELLSLVNFTAADDKGNHYYLTSNYSGTIYKFFQAVSLYRKLNMFFHKNWVKPNKPLIYKDNTHEAHQWYLGNVSTTPNVPGKVFMCDAFRNANFNDYDFIPGKTLEYFREL